MSRMDGQLISSSKLQSDEYSIDAITSTVAAAA
jgi:hypothetical protein